MQTLAVLALIIGMIMLFQWLGATAGRSHREKNPTPHNPEADIPPPTDYFIS